MQVSAQMLQMRISASSLVISGILFVLYPMIRPFSDETSLQGAIAFASTNWLVAHILAIVAFTLLPLGLLGLHQSLQGTALNSLSYWAIVLCLLGIGLTLPFYGGETFGLHAIGQEALRQQDATLVSLSTVVRSGIGLVMFLIGLLLLNCCNSTCYRNLAVRKLLNGVVFPLLLGWDCIFRNFSATSHFE